MADLLLDCRNQGAPDSGASSRERLGRFLQSDFAPVLGRDPSFF